MSLWNPDNIRDVGEAVGIGALNKDVVENLVRDVDYRISQVLDEAIKFMRKSKRTTLHTDDISQALRVLDVEPLFGYESTRPLRFGEASIGPGQPLFYVEDEEVDFEKLINAPLPKVPREISFTAHWLAVEGVQPSIPQNPSSTDPRHQELLPKGPGQHVTHLAALAGLDSATAKPQVKHVLSSELQLYFERITSAILDENNEEYRSAAFNSVRTDPGLHQLVPYFVQYTQEKVTHSMKDLFILQQMLSLIHALLQNQSLFLEPYISKLVPPILTCLQARKPGSGSEPPGQVYELRDMAAALLIAVCKKYGKSSQTLKPKLARSLLKTFLSPQEPFGAHYGAIMGFQGITGPEGVRTAIIPNLKLYDEVLREGLADDGKRRDAEQVTVALLTCLSSCVTSTTAIVNGELSEQDTATKVIEKVGEVLGKRIMDAGDSTLIKVVLDVGQDLR
jgi:transcription initiation factor TFIID subunit 6